MKKSLQKFCSLALVLTTATTAMAGVSMLGQNEESNKGIYADTAQNTTNVLKISAYEKECELGLNKIKMPTLEYFQAAQIKAIVTDPIGKQQEIAYTQSGNTYTPVVATVDAEYADNYKIEFVVETGSNKYTAEIIVKVVATKGTISLLDGNLVKNAEGNYVRNERLMPEKVKNDFVGELKVPEYEVKDSEGNIIAGADVSIEVEKDGKYYSVDKTTGVINFGDKTKSLKELNVATGTYTIVYTATANGAFLDRNTSTTFEIVDSTKYDYELKTSWNSTLDVIRVGETTTLPTLTGKNGDDKVAVSYTVKVFCDGQDVSNTYVNPYITTGDALKVLSINEDGEYQITANQKDKYYTVKYEVYDMFGNQTTAEFNINTIKVPSKTTPIVVDKAYDYNTAENTPNLEILELKDASYKLKTYFAPNEPVKILPIFANDSSTFALKDYISVTRKIVAYSTSAKVWEDTFEIQDGELVTTSNKIAVFNAEDDYTAGADEVIAKKTENGSEVNVKLDNDRRYEVVYTVKNKYGVEDSVRYSFYISDKATAIEDSTVEFTEALPDRVDAGEDIEVKGINASNTNDDNLNKYIAYRYNGTGKWIELKANDDGKYIIKTEGVDNLTKVEVTAIAEDDRSEYKSFDEIFNTESTGKTLAEIQEMTGVTVYGTKDGGVYTPKSVEITVTKVDFSDDTQAPLFTTTGTDTDIKDADGNDYKVASEVSLPDAYIEDDNLSSVGFDVIIRKIDDEGNTVQDYSLTKMVAITAGNIQKFTDMKFQVPESGKYVVIYVAEDGARNKAYKYYNMTIADQEVKENPKFISLTASDVTIERGEKYNLPQATTNLKDTQILDGKEYIVTVSGQPGYKLNGTQSFTANKVGEYIVEYKLNFDLSTITDPTERAKVEEQIEAETKSFKITVEDTIAPEINIINKGSVKTYYDKNTTMLIPFATSPDEDIDEDKSTVKVTSSKTGTVKEAKSFKEMKEAYRTILANAQTAFNEKEAEDTRTLADFVEVEMNKDGSLFKVNLLRDEQYTITYTVYDNNTPKANSRTETIVFKVGDTVSPTLEVKDLSELFGNILPTKVGNDGFKVDLSSLKSGLITYSDDKTDYSGSEYPVKMELKLNGSTVKPSSQDGSVYEYDELEAGDYTIVFTIEDDAKNSTSVEKTFTVEAESNEGMTDAQIIGTVLIVLSVVVLAGVVVYFIVTKKKTDKLYK